MGEQRAVTTPKRMQGAVASECGDAEGAAASALRIRQLVLDDLGNIIARRGAISRPGPLTARKAGPASRTAIDPQVPGRMCHRKPGIDDAGFDDAGEALPQAPSSSALYDRRKSLSAKMLMPEPPWRRGERP